LSEPEPELEKRGGYEGWLDELAGERVKALPIFVGWVLMTGMAAGLAYLLGARSDGVSKAVFGVVSIPYGLWVVPWHLKRRRRARG